MEHTIITFREAIWSVPMIMLCIGAGLLFSVSTRFLQIRYIKEMLNQIISSKSSAAGISPFQSLLLSLSGRLGTGNIAGVATALISGGPGALFWMWVIAFLGAGSAFAESTLGQIYKTKEKGEYRGGPAHYIEKGLGEKWKWYAVLFSMASLLAYTVFMPGLQANTITMSMETAFGIPPAAMGMAMVISLIFIIKGGIKGFARFSEVVIPFMSVGYLLVAWIIIGINFRQIPDIFMLVIRSALGMEELFAGMLGSAINYGIRRGVFSTEAGMGSQVSASAAAETDHPAKQGLVQAFSIYIDTFMVNTATGFMLLMTGMYNVIAPTGEVLVNNLPHLRGDSGAEYTIYAIDSVFVGWGSAITAIVVFLFAFTIFVSHYYIAETNLIYVTKGTQTKGMLLILQIIFLTTIFQGSIASSTMAWAMADIGVGISVWLNLIAILLLYKPVILCFKDYERQYKEGKNPVFNAKAAGIENADFWDGKRKL